MARHWMIVAVAVIALLAGAHSTVAGGVVIVSRTGVQAFKGAEAGFMQMAYTVQLPGFSPKVVELDGTAADDAALAALKAENPDVVFAVGSYAAKKVRQVLPTVWIVYGMVYYPEVEGLTGDPKMVGIDSLGPPKGLASLVKPMSRSKSLVVLHSQSIMASVSSLVTALNSAGFDAQSKAVASVGDLQGAFQAVKDQFKILLLLPDPLTANPDAMRYLISQCVDAKILPVALTESMVASGALCAVTFQPEAVGSHAAKVVQQILAGKPPQDRVVEPSTFTTVINKGTAGALKINISKINAEITYE